MKIALGTAQFGMAYGIANAHGVIDDDAALAILNLARASGIDTLDTAVAYGDAERRIGRVGARGFRIVTKLPGLPGSVTDVRGWVEGHVSESLERLGVDRLHGVLVHRPGDLAEGRGDELSRALLAVQDAELTNRVGLSIYDPRELEMTARTFHPGLVQAPFSVLDQRLISGGWADELVRGGTEVHARSIFLQGLLLMPRGSRPPAFDKWRSIFGSYEAWLSEVGLTPLEACVRAALSPATIHRVVVGVDHVGHLAQIVAAAAGGGVPLPMGLSTDDVELLTPFRWPS